MKAFKQAAARFPKSDEQPASINPADTKSWVEQEQPVPVLTPDGMQEVNRAHFNARWAQEKKRMAHLNDKAEQLYGKPLTAIRQASQRHQTRNDFNMYAAQERDLQQI